MVLPKGPLLWYYSGPALINSTLKLHGRNFVVKCGGDNLMQNQYNRRADAEVKL